MCVLLLWWYCVPPLICEVVVISKVGCVKEVLMSARAGRAGRDRVKVKGCWEEEERDGGGIKARWLCVVGKQA